MEPTENAPSRLDLNLRLRAQAQRLVDALEAIPAPETFIEAQRFAKALVMVDKAVAQIMTEPELAPTEAATRKAVETVAAKVIERMQPDFQKSLDRASTQWWNEAMKGAQRRFEEEDAALSPESGP